MQKHATAFDLVLWATMMGAFELAEVLWKHKSCESPLRAALIGQARRPRPPRDRATLDWLRLPLTTTPAAPGLFRHGFLFLPHL